VRRIGGPLSSTKSGNGKGTVPVNVAVIDTGVQTDHPDLNVVGGVDCANDGNPTFSDVFGHGTFVGGLIGAKDNSFGIVGIAPGAHLWSVRVLDANDEGEDSNLLCGLDWVAGTRTDKNPHNDIAVANMSLEGPIEAPLDGHCGKVQIDLLHQAVCKVTQAGVPLVAAAGNDSADFAGNFPAAYPEVLTMTGMADSDGLPGGVGGPEPCLQQADDTPAFFSNFAVSQADQAHALAAPAVCVSSDYFGSDVATDSGTSFASPLGTGVVALCIADGPCGGPSAKATIRKVINDTTRYNTKNPTWGFQGDPAHPVAGKYYGWLLQAGLY
jgi:subtilisin